MKLHQLIEQLSVTQYENLVSPQSGNSTLTWKQNFLTKFGQVTITEKDEMHNGTKILAVARTNDPNNITRLQPEFGTVLIEPPYLTLHRSTITSANENLKRQCVALVQAATTNSVKVEKWIRGTPAINGLEQWSIIATFNGPGTTYWNSVMHTGFYVGSDDEGFYMISQNMNGTGDIPVGGLDLRKFFFSYTQNNSGNPSLYYLVTVNI